RPRAPDPARPRTEAPGARPRPLRFPELAAGEAAPVQRERGLGDTELRRECKRPLGGSNRPGILPFENAAPGHVGMGGDELRPGGLRLEQLDCLGDDLFASWLAEPMDYEP